MDECQYYSGKAFGGICQNFERDMYWQAACPFDGDTDMCMEQEQ